MTRSLWTKEDVNLLRHLWPERVSTTIIASRLGREWKDIQRKAEKLGLPPRQNLAQAKSRHARKVGDLRHRRAIALRFDLTPPIVVRPSPTLFGAPIRAVAAAERALIDAYLEEERA